MNNRLAILIVTQPDYPVPPVNDGAQSIVIYDTVRNITLPGVRTISLWHPRLNGVRVDSSKFRIVKNSLFFRVIRKCIIAIRGVLYMPSQRYQDLLVSIYLDSLFHPNTTLVVHSTKMPWLLELKRWFPRKQIISYHHSSEDHECPADVFEKVVAEIDGHIFVSRNGERLFLEKAKIVAPSRQLRSTTIQNGIDLSAFAGNPEQRKAAKRQWNVDDGKVVLLFAGRLIERKGLIFLLEALTLLSRESKGKVRLVIAGGSDFFNEAPSPYLDRVREKLKALEGNVEVTHVGYIAHDRIHSLFLAADLLLFTSIQAEGSPLALLEAAAAALPVIATDPGGITEIVTDGETGFVLPLPLQPVQLAGKLEELIIHPERRLEMGRRATLRAAERFSSKAMAKQFLKVVTAWSGKTSEHGAG